MSGVTVVALEIELADVKFLEPHSHIFGAILVEGPSIPENSPYKARTRVVTLKTATPVLPDATQTIMIPVDHLNLYPSSQTVLRVEFSSVAPEQSRGLGGNSILISSISSQLRQRETVRLQIRLSLDGVVTGSCTVGLRIASISTGSPATANAVAAAIAASSAASSAEPRESNANHNHHSSNTTINGNSSNNNNNNNSNNSANNAGDPDDMGIHSDAVAITVRHAVNLPMSASAPACFVAAKLSSQRNQAAKAATSLVKASRNPVWNRTLEVVVSDEQLEQGDELLLILWDTENKYSVLTTISLALFDTQLCLWRPVSAPAAQSQDAAGIIDPNEDPAAIAAPGIMYSVLVHGSLDSTRRFFAENKTMVRMQVVIAGIEAALEEYDEVVAVLRIVHKTAKYIKKINKTLKTKKLRNTFPTFPLIVVGENTNIMEASESVVVDGEGPFVTTAVQCGKPLLFQEGFPFTFESSAFADPTISLAIEFFARAGIPANLEDAPNSKARYIPVAFAAVPLNIFPASGGRLCVTGIPVSWASPAFKHESPRPSSRDSNTTSETAVSFAVPPSGPPLTIEASVFTASDMLTKVSARELVAMQSNKKQLINPNARIIGFHEAMAAADGMVLSGRSHQSKQSPVDPKSQRQSSQLQPQQQYRGQQQQQHQQSQPGLNSTRTSAAGGFNVFLSPDATVVTNATAGRRKGAGVTGSSVYLTPYDPGSGLRRGDSTGLINTTIPQQPQRSQPAQDPLTDWTDNAGARQLDSHTAFLGNAESTSFLRANTLPSNEHSLAILSAKPDPSQNQLRKLAELSSAKRESLMLLMEEYEQNAARIKDYGERIKELRRSNDKMLAANTEMQSKPPTRSVTEPRLEDFHIHTLTREEVIEQYLIWSAKARSEGNARDAIEARLASIKGELAGYEEGLETTLEQHRSANALLQARTRVLERDIAEMSVFKPKAREMDAEVSRLELEIAREIGLAGKPKSGGGFDLASLEEQEQQLRRDQEELRALIDENLCLSVMVQSNNRKKLSASKHAGDMSLSRQLEQERARAEQLNRVLTQHQSSSDRERIEEAEIVLQAINDEIRERTDTFEREKRLLRERIALTRRQGPTPFLS